MQLFVVLARGIEEWLPLLSFRTPWQVRQDELPRRDSIDLPELDRGGRIESRPRPRIDLRECDVPRRGCSCCAEALHEISAPPCVSVGPPLELPAVEAFGQLDIVRRVDLVQ